PRSDRLVLRLRLAWHTCSWSSCYASHTKLLTGSAVLLVLIMAAGLVVYFSFVFGRTAKIKLEISKTKQQIEIASGDQAK
ncbi:hypothetical protein, partial [Rhizobacter sp. Root16D2]